MPKVACGGKKKKGDRSRPLTLDEEIELRRRPQRLVRRGLSLRRPRRHRASAAHYAPLAYPSPCQQGPGQHFDLEKSLYFFFLAERGSGIVDVDGNQSRWSLERRGDPQRSAPKAKAIEGRRDASRRGPAYPPPRTPLAEPSEITFARKRKDVLRLCRACFRPARPSRWQELRGWSGVVGHALGAPPSAAEVRGSPRRCPAPQQQRQRGDVFQDLEKRRWFVGLAQLA